MPAWRCRADLRHQLHQGMGLARELATEEAWASKARVAAWRRVIAFERAAKERERMCGSAEAAALFWTDSR